MRETLWQEQRQRMREGKERGLRGFKVRPLKGFITTRDMVKLEELKNRYFFDDDAVKT